MKTAADVIRHNLLQAGYQASCRDCGYATTYRTPLQHVAAELAKADGWNPIDGRLYCRDCHAERTAEVITRPFDWSSPHEGGTR